MLLAGAEECAHARPRLGVGQGNDNRDAGRSGLAHAGAKPHHLDVLARIVDGVVASGQRFRHADQGLAGRAATRRYLVPWPRPSKSGPSLELSPTGQIQAGPIWSKIRRTCCAIRAFLPNSTSPQVPHAGSNDSCQAGLPPAGVRCLRTAHDI